MDYFLNPTNLVQNNIQNKLISRLRVSITIIILFNFIELLYAEFPQIKNLSNYSITTMQETLHDIPLHKPDELVNIIKEFVKETTPA